MISSSSVGFVEENWDGIGGTDEMKDPINLSAGTSPLLFISPEKTFGIAGWHDSVCIRMHICVFIITI